MARSPVASSRARPARRDPGRPSRLRLWLKRRRGLMRPAALGVMAFGLLGGIGYAVYAADPAGHMRSMVENVGDIGLGMGLEVREVVVVGRKNTPSDLIHAAVGAQRGDLLRGKRLHSTEGVAVAAPAV